MTGFDLFYLFLIAGVGVIGYGVGRTFDAGWVGAVIGLATGYGLYCGLVFYGRLLDRRQVRRERNESDEREPPKSGDANPG